MIDFIQLGANIGNTPQDIMWEIVRENNWKGIFVEPLPHIFTQLEENYSDVTGCHFENVAIIDYDGEIHIHYEPHDNCQISSINPNHSRSKNKKSIIVPCIKLITLIEKYDMVDVPFTLLQIDVEGLDGLILKSTDFTHVLPKFIRFEHCHLGRNGNTPLSEVMQHLEKFGYKQIPDMYDNDRPIAEKGIDTMLERQI